MKNKRKAIIITLIMLTACIIFFAGFCIWKHAASREELISAASSYSGEDLTVTDLDVGKADASVIIYKDCTGIIDTGTEEAFPVIDAYLKAHAVDDIDYMILTHFDADHVGSVIAILRNYDVKAVYYPDYVSEKKYYAPVMKELKGRDCAFAVDEDLSFASDMLKVDILPASDPEPLLSEKSSMDNNMSLLCRMTFGQKKLLFTGDIEKDRISQLLESDEDLTADWIKLPHHGALEKHEKKLIKKVAPEYAVISTSDERPPNEELLEYLDKKEIEYHTTMDENVTTVCDGLTIEVE